MIDKPFDIIDIYKNILAGNIARFPSFTWSIDYGHKIGFYSAKQCIHYLIIDVLKYSRDDILTNVCSELFKKYKLSGMLNELFDNNPYKAISYTFPELHIKQWEMKRSSPREWDEQDKILAIKWLVEDRLKLNHDQIASSITIKHFIDNGLRGLLNQFYNSSPYLAISAAYPERDWSEIKENISKRSAARIRNFSINSVGVNHKRAKIRDIEIYEQVLANLKENKLNYTEIGKLFGVDYRVIMRIANKEGIVPSARGRWGKKK